MYYKFGGKRLLKRAKEYMKKNAFSIEPITCENTTCKSCAVFNLPFKVKSYKACAEMGFVRKRGKTNFTVDFNVVNKNMFHRHVEVGDIANCHEFESEPDAEYPIASLVGKVCVQGFEFKIDSKKIKDENGKPKRKAKFCLALVFKRWATGYRFCIERTEKKKKVTEKGKEILDKLRPGKNKGSSNETQKSQGKMRDQGTGKLVWKVELKKIAAGEQENQIVGDKPLFKGESQKRQKDAAKDLGAE
uniref:Uncharacterized protein n=1 Tax=Lygus hesperus TaxID=30085 RepID=A0A0A9XJX9_LYGHE